MLGSEIIEYMGNKFNKKEGFNWMDWIKVKQDISPDHDYPIRDMKISWKTLKEVVREQRIKVLLGDIC